MNELIKPQPSLRGLNAWVFAKLLQRMGTNAADGAAWVIDRWIHENESLLKQKYNIDFDAYFRQNESEPLACYPSSAKSKSGNEE